MPSSATPRTSRVLINPILPGFYPDPSIVRVGEDFYLVTSTFEYFPGVPIFHSRDLINWRQLGHVLTRPSQLPLDGALSSQGIYAPTLRYHAGTFYMITTNMSVGKSFYVTTTDPAGDWSEPVWIQERTSSMDPSLLFDDDGKVYYTRHGGGEHGGAYQAELDLETGQLREEAKLIWSGTGGDWPEGPHLYKISGSYYLMLAEGGTGYDHNVTIARSVSPWGPYEACPRNPIFTHRQHREHPIQATGHGDLVQDGDDRWWLVFLGIRPPDAKNHHLGRETFLAPVTWDADGWPVINDGQLVALETRTSALPRAHPWGPDVASPARASSVRDDFDSERLAYHWNFLRNPKTSSWSLRERPGWLRLNGSHATLDEPVSPAFIGRRQQHLNCRVTARLEFHPQSAEQEAGLTLRANEDNHYDLFVSGPFEARTVTLRSRTKGESRVLAQRALEGDRVALEIKANPEQYSFGFSTDSNGAGASLELGTTTTASLSSEQAGGFTGVYLGMYAQSGSPGPMPAADFDWFDYVAND